MTITTRPAFRLATASLTALILGSGAAMADTWRYAFEEALDEVQGVYAQKFKEEVEANSDHEVQLFPFGTLGESDNIMEQTQSGILQFVNQSPGFTGSLIPEAQVFFVPYLLPEDDDQLFAFFRNSEAINTIFPELYAQQGLELLSMYPEGEVMVTSNRPIAAPADFDDVKVRVMTNPLLVSSYQAFGATPTPLPWGEVYGGLQTGIVDAQENPAFFIESTRMYEVQDHITRLGHNNFTTALMANQEFFDGPVPRGPAGGPRRGQDGVRPHHRISAGPDRGVAGEDHRRPPRGHRDHPDRGAARALPRHRRPGRGDLPGDRRSPRTGGPGPDEGGPVRRGPGLIPVPRPVLRGGAPKRTMMDRWP